MSGGKYIVLVSINFQAFKPSLKPIKYVLPCDMKCNRFQSTCNTVASIYYLCQGSYVFISVVLVSLYVSRIMQKLLY